MRFSARQKKLLSLCVVLYSVLYLCRLNLSAALDAVAVDLDLSLAAAGGLQTVFALVYACGQVINGTIVDHVNPFAYMLTGLAGAGICNLLMSAAGGYEMMLAAWALNAVFQSMLWTPIIRVVARVFTSEGERDTANAALAVTLIAGHFFAWAISGVMAERLGWRFSFLVPGVIALITSAAALCLLRDEYHSPQWRGNRPARSRVRGERNQKTQGQTLLNAGFLFVLGTCVLYGFVRDGVITWTPTILARHGRAEQLRSTAFTLVLPVINAAGVMAGVWLRARGARPRRVVAAMMSAAMICFALLLPVDALLLMALLLGLACAALYGANTMLTGLIPMEYDSIGKSGMTAGLVDAFIYLGSALAGVLAGGIYDAAGDGMLYLIWIGAAALGAAMMMASQKLNK